MSNRGSYAPLTAKTSRAYGNIWRLRIDQRRFADSPGEFLNCGELLFEGIDSALFVHGSQADWVVKMMRPKSLPRDVFRRYSWSCAAREYYSSLRIQDLGLQVAIPVGYAIALNPFGRFDSVIVMDRVREHVSLKKFLETAQKESARRRFLEKAATGYASIYGNGFHLADSHFGNNLISNDQLIWIDNDLRWSSNKSTQMARLNKAIFQLYRHTFKIVDDTEWQFFKSAFVHGLKDKQFSAHLIRAITSFLPPPQWARPASRTSEHTVDVRPSVKDAEF